MLMIIKTNGATHIAINVPTGASSTMLPSLVSLLENNATFVKQDWSTLERVDADISVELKHKFVSERNETELLITSEDAVAISEDFTAVSPEVMVSIKKTLENKNKEVEKMRRERDDYKRRLELLEEEVAGMQEEERS